MATLATKVLFVINKAIDKRDGGATPAMDFRHVEGWSPETNDSHPDGIRTEPSARKIQGHVGIGDISFHGGESLSPDQRRAYHEHHIDRIEKIRKQATKEHYGSEIASPALERNKHNAFERLTTALRQAHQSHSSALFHLNRSKAVSKAIDKRDGGATPAMDFDKEPLQDHLSSLPRYINKPLSEHTTPELLTLGAKLHDDHADAKKKAISARMQWATSDVGPTSGTASGAAERYPSTLESAHTLVKQHLEERGAAHLLGAKGTLDSLHGFSKAKDVPGPVPAAHELPEHHAHYFDLSQPHEMIPVAHLTPSKPPESQPKSVDNAMKFMGMAKRGEMDKRAPITVLKRPDGTHHVTDGNATYGAASRLGWTHLPARVVDEAGLQKAIALSGLVQKSTHGMTALGMPPHVAAVSHMNPPSRPAFTQNIAAPSHNTGMGETHEASGAGSPQPVYKPEPLFKHGEESLPKPVQPSNDAGELWHQASIAHNDLQEALDRGKGYSADAGHLPVVDYGAAPDGKTDPEGSKAFHADAASRVGSHPKGAVIFGPMKDRARAEVKAAADRDPKNPNAPLPLNGVLDISRATVMAHKHHDLHEAIAHVAKHMNANGFEIARAKDKYQKPEDTGYRNVISNWRHKKTGHVVEVQFADKDMEHAKHNGGHAHYEQTRKIDDTMKAEGREHRTPEEEAIFQHHNKAQQQMYGDAWNQQVAKHAHLAKAVTSPMRRFGVVFKHGVHTVMSAAHLNPTAYVGFYKYGDDTPAYWGLQHAPKVWRGDKWHPLYDSGHFRKESEKISKSEFEKLAAKHGAPLPSVPTK